MIDLFSLALCHGLLLITAWRLVRRPDLDRDMPAADPKATAETRGWGSRGA